MTSFANKGIILGLLFVLGSTGDLLANREDVSGLKIFSAVSIITDSSTKQLESVMFIGNPTAARIPIKELKFGCSCIVAGEIPKIIEPFAGVTVPINISVKQKIGLDSVKGIILGNSNSHLEFTLYWWRQPSESFELSSNILTLHTDANGRSTTLLSLFGQEDLVDYYAISKLPIGMDIIEQKRIILAPGIKRVDFEIVTTEQFDVSSERGFPVLFESSQFLPTKLSISVRKHIRNPVFPSSISFDNITVGEPLICNFRRPEGVIKEITVKGSFELSKKYEVKFSEDQISFEVVLANRLSEEIGFYEGEVVFVFVDGSKTEVSLFGIFQN